MPGTSLETVRAAVVGGGAFGECHLRTYRSMAHVEIAGVYTLEADRAAQLAGVYGGRAYASIEELADDPSIDLVTIATPEDAHASPFAQLAARGKAIYVEKPLATSPQEARDMLQQSRSIIAMCGHCLRFESRLARAFQQQPRLGRLRHMSFTNRRQRGQKRIYGRTHPAYVLLCHEIELANAFAQSPFRRVCAIETRYNGGQIDAISMMIEYDSGATAVIEGGWVLADQLAVHEHDDVTLDFDGGTVLINLPNTGLALLDGEGWRFINQHYEHSVYGMEFGALRAALEHMVDCVRRRRQPQISTIEDGYRAVQLVDAAIRSARDARWIERDPE